MKHLKQKILFICILAGLVNLACFWDYDTLAMERVQFPNVIELISGKFLRHSSQFYYWRILDREHQLKQNPDNISFYDDLAVAYSKLGNDKKAIEVILKKEKIKPNLYETYANLGTFYMLDGQIDSGIVNIKKAIKINSDAHFGREIYQLYLAEYMKSKMVSNKISLPLAVRFSDSPHDIDFAIENFYSFVVSKYFSKTKTKEKRLVNRLPQDELLKAIKGVAGMMKFANYDSPILLEVLGDLLLGYGDTDGARQLAARAYLRAAEQVDSKEAKKIYQKKIEFLLYHQVTQKGHKRISLDLLNNLLQQEISLGNSFFQNILDDEIKWIKAGLNPEIEFSKKYYIEPTISQKAKVETGVTDEEFLKNTLIKDTMVGKNLVLVEISKIATNTSLDEAQKKEIEAAYAKYLTTSKIESNEVSNKPANKIVNEDSTNNTYVFVLIAVAVLIIGALILNNKKK